VRRGVFRDAQYRSDGEVKALVEDGVRVVDLSADFRIRTLPSGEVVRGQARRTRASRSGGVRSAGSESRKIKGARLVANPGCYPTAVQLGLLALAKPAPSTWIT